ncbi:MAG: T9SS type A sorting domain-containing protein [Bacteroidales bacterium]|nr:T9SS type A sorting domain-containing protein [Bacteroidales bacterium]
MIKYLIYAVVFLTSVNINAQTLIATSNHPEAIANHNQRKIVRDSLDNVYIVFIDTNNQENVINGVMFDNITGKWNNSTYIINGNNPTLSIFKNGKIHLVFESNDSITEIRHTSSLDFSNWTSDIVLSDTAVRSEHPVADIDSAGNLNVFWIQNNDSLNESLIYACVNGDTLIERKYITAKSEINDIAIANHLQFFENDLFFAIQYDQDSLQFFISTNNMENYDTIYSIIGSQPCISFNSLYPEEYYLEDDNMLRLLYINTNSQLIEIETGTNYSNINSAQIPVGSIDYVCIDNIAPPIGFSYLFMQNGNLYHGFSYGAYWDWSTILDTISGNIIHPSIAYKQFNFEYVDFIWMENNGNDYNIYHKRDEKHNGMSIEDHEQGKGFSIVGYPNPFTEQLSINVSVNDQKAQPIIQIYNSNSQLVKILHAEHSSANEFSYKWYGKNQNSDKVNSGIYIIMCSVGDTKTARKVVYIK